MSVSATGKTVTFSGAAFVPYSSATRNVKLGDKSLTANNIDYSVSPLTPPVTEGSTSWNSSTKTLNIYPGIAGSTLEVGQKEWVPVTNLSGANIPTNTVVYVTSTGGGVDHMTIAPASAAVAGNTNYIIGITTDPIENGADGFVTTRGYVHNYNTSTYTKGTGLYVSDLVLGGLTNIQPTPPNYTYLVAVTQDATVNGTIYVRFGSPDASINSTLAAVASKDPTGWNFNDSVVVNYDSTTRTVTLTGDLRYSWRGKINTLTSPWTSAAHSATNGKYYLLSLDGVNFTWETTPRIFSDIQVAFVNYGVSDKYAIRETHGLMPWQAHEEFHQSIGTYRTAGGVLSGYTLASAVAANRRPSVSATYVKDEDDTTINPALTSTLYTKHFLTSTGTTNFTVETADIVPLAGAQPYWNQLTGGLWQQTLMANNTYMSVWLVAVPTGSDTTSQKYRYVWVQGQSNGTLAGQQARNPSDLNLGQLVSLATEFVFINKLILRYTAGDWTIEQVDILTSNRNSVTSSPVGVFLSTVAHDTTLSGLGTPDAPLSAAHNNLAGLQGGTTAEYYHLTSAEYTGTGTGNFARKSSPVFTTPNIGSATGSISGNAGTATALQTPRTINSVLFDGTANIQTAITSTSDYAATTWIPDVQIGGANTGITYSSRAGKYTQIGNMIYFQFYLALTSKGALTGAVTVAGLPFVVNNTALYYVPFTAAGNVMGATVNSLVAYGTPNSSVIVLKKLAAGSVSDVANTDLNNTTEFFISGTYQK
jgi:hypothetical protein